MTEHKTMMPTMQLRFVDKSICPQASTKKVLQQRYIDVHGQSEWLDVPFAGHINEVEP